MKQFIEKIKKDENLTFDESKSAFELLMEGKAEDQEIFDFLTLLSAKGESSDEVAGGVFVLRNKSKRVNVENCVDTCGTGGDGMNTLNQEKKSEEIAKEDSFNKRSKINISKQRKVKRAKLSL